MLLVVLGSMTKERFKITNPNKVACQVAVSVRPREAVPKVCYLTFHKCVQIFVKLFVLSDATQGVSVEFPFDVEPKKIVIPSHDSQFVTVAFAPQAMQRLVLLE